MADRFDIQKLMNDPQVVAQTATSDEVFGFFTREMLVPPSCVALVFGSGHQPAVVSAGRTIEADGARELLIIRNLPFEIEYSFHGVASSDGFSFDADVQIAVAIVPERIELESFRTTVVSSRREVRIDRLKQHCEDVVRSALESFARERPAEKLVQSTTWDEFDAILMTAFGPLGFESGLGLGSDPRITMRSAGFDESRQAAKSAAARAERDREEQARREAAAKARESRLTEVGATLERLRAMAGPDGVFNVAEILKTFDLGQRGELYHGLLSANGGSTKTHSILAVVGSELIWLDPRNLQTPTRRLRLPKDAGSLRSVRVMSSPLGRQILVGAKNGVHVLQEDGDTPKTYTFTAPDEIRGGVNSAVIAGTGLYATHSEVGFLRWNLENAGVMRQCLSDFTEGAHAIRDLQLDAAGRIWLAVDNLAICRRPDDDAALFAYPAPSEITSLVVADDHAIAGLRDGSVVRWLIGESKPEMETIRPGAGKPVLSVDWIAGGGIPRILIGDGRPLLDLQVFGDSYAAQYRSMHELKWGFAAEDVVVGVNDRRDHIFVWTHANPEMPSGALAVGRLTGRSIQDLVLI